MNIRRLGECPEIIAGDHVRLRELLHPERAYPFSGRYSLAHAVLPPGQSSVRHKLQSSEVYYILEGRGEIHIDAARGAVAPGDVIEIPVGAEQWIRNSSDVDLVFLCIVDPAWRSDDEDICSGQ